MKRSSVGYRMVLAVNLWLCLATAHAAVLINEAHVVASSDSVAAATPAAQNFTVTNAGQYTVTLTDVGKQSNAGAYAFTALSLVIYQNSQVVKVISVAEATASLKTDSVALVAGNYSAQVLGTTTGASLYSVLISNSASTVLNTAGAITSVSSTTSSDLSTLQPQLSLVAGRSYTLSTSDIAFPAALSSLNVTILVNGANLPCQLTATSGPCTFVAGNQNQLFAIAAKSPTAAAGLYSIRLVDTTTSSAVISSVYPVGNLSNPVSVTLPTTDAYQILGTDLKTPDPLNNLQLLLLQDVTVLASQSVAGTSQLNTFNANAGTAKLYVVGSATSNGGIYGVQISRTGTVVYSNASVISPANTINQTGYFFAATLPAAGNYVLNLNDLNFPQSFKTLSVAVTQGGVTIGTLSAAGTLTINNAAAGAIQINVIAQPNAAGQGLFGLTLAASNSTTKLLSVTQGVGGTFVSIPVTVGTAGSYALNVSDMLAPQRLGQMLVAVTRDTQFIAEVIGTTSVNVNATPGNYVLNVIANTDTVANAPFGMYGIAFGEAPAVSLTPSATSVTSGGSIFMNWTSTDATSCVASDAWSGTKATSGNETIGPLTADTKFTLSCTGVTGSTSKSVTVQLTIAPTPTSSSKGGGGAMQDWMLGMMLLLAGMRALGQASIYKRRTPDRFQPF